MEQKIIKRKLKNILIQKKDKMMKRDVTDINEIMYLLNIFSIERKLREKEYYILNIIRERKEFQIQSK